MNVEMRTDTDAQCALMSSNKNFLSRRQLIKRIEKTSRTKIDGSKHAKMFASQNHFSPSYWPLSLCPNPILAHQPDEAPLDRAVRSRHALHPASRK